MRNIDAMPAWRYNDDKKCVCLSLMFVNEKEVSMNSLKKMISLVLMVCMLLSAVPVTALAAEDISATPVAQEQTQEEPGVSQTEPAAEAEEVTVLWEDETLRGEYEKHFLMSDGSYQAVVYSYPVHELVDGVWVEIESTNQNARGDVSPSDARSNIIDNFVWEGHGVQNNNAIGLDIGLRSGYRCRAFIRFATMPTIPAGSTITAATMTVNIVSGTSTANNAAAYQVDSYWESATIQWSNKPTLGTLQAANISHNNKTKYQFSCLEAVKDWYNGSTTGQNKNYGIMLRYADETINDYNSFYSADYSNAALRPSITISYDPLSAVVQEGDSCTLTAPSTGGSVTWASGNTAVATITSAGYLTGVKAGTTTVTASVNGTVIEKYNVYVIISEGVYYIGDGDGLYLGTSGSPATGTDTFLQPRATSSRGQLNQLWRVDHLRNGYYSVRPLYKLDMGLTSENGNTGMVEITTIGTTDSWSNVSAASRWTIEFNSNGYVFCCAGTSYMTMYRRNPEAGGSIWTAPSATAASESKWILEGVSSVTNQLLLMDASSGTSIEGGTFYISRGETVTLEELRITASFVCGYNLNQSMSWYSANPANVSIDSSTGTMTANIPDGNSTIYVKHIHNGVVYTKSFKVIVNRQMTEFIDKMGALYDVAYAYEFENQTKAFETLFKFIRVQRYNELKWVGIAGETDSVFVDYINGYYPELYSYFVPDSTNASSEYNVNTVFDTCSDGYIDVIHMAAVLNRLFYTGETNYLVIPDVGVIEEVVDDLSGWAGDSQSLIKEYLRKYKNDETYEDIYYNFYPMIGNAAYSFDYADVISDLDACNLYTLLTSQTITTGQQFKAVLNGYYSGSVGNVAAKRFTTWIGSYTADTLQDKFYDYCNDYSPYAINWPILLGYSVTDEQQEVFSQALADYFRAQKLKE